MSRYFDLKKYRIFTAQGKDATTFLQGQVTADLHNLSGVVLTATCNIKGRVVANYWLWRDEDVYYFLCPASTTERLLKQFNQYRLRADVHFNEQKTLQIIGCITPSEDEGFPTTAYAWAHYGDGTVLAIPGTPQLRFILLLPKTSGHSLDTETETAVWDEQDIATTLGEIVQETSGIFIPQMLYLEKNNGMSFEKGCYLGQEIIARLHFKGKLKRRLYRASVSTENEHTILPGEKIYHQQAGQVMEAGIVLSAVRDQTGTTALLAVIEDRFVDTTPLKCILTENQLTIATPSS